MYSPLKEHRIRRKRGNSSISLSEPTTNKIPFILTLEAKKKNVSNGHLKAWTNKTHNLCMDRCFYHLSVHEIRSQISYSEEDSKQSTRSLVSVCVCFVCMCVQVCVCVCGLRGGGYYFSLVVAQSCLSCGTSVGCVMGFVERCSVSGVKQAQSRAPPDTTGTSGRSLWGFVHTHICRAYYRMKR